MTLAAEPIMMSTLPQHAAAAAVAAAAAAAAASAQHHATANSTPNSNNPKSSKLGFSIDSIVGKSNSKDSSQIHHNRDLNMSPTDLSLPLPLNHKRKRSRSRSRSKSRSRSRSPPSENTPTTPPLVRPIPTSFPGGISPQTYLDHLANLKALYDQQQAAVASSQAGQPHSPVSPTSTSPAASSAITSACGATTTTSSIGPPPPHAALHSGHPPGLPHGLPPGLAFPRPGMPGAPGGLPPMLFPGGPQIPPQIPREYPLYPWFISRRFPGGKSKI